MAAEPDHPAEMSNDCLKSTEVLDGPFYGDLCLKVGIRNIQLRCSRHTRSCSYNAMYSANAIGETCRARLKNVG